MRLELTAEGRDILLYPLQREPLVLEAKVTCNLGFVASKETECRQSVAYVDPDFGTFCGNILRLAAQSVRGPELEETRLEVRDQRSDTYSMGRPYPPWM